ncbi:prepilin-type N-terminal cleavage/methylation domain-containing protein [Planococcus sp. X10-3]|uniref:prepilin-type N-terminal cleavage/methylation domain-containing protein n=1 Tax=Planococcus sp. X10-3 TaxID=3061240 RepID=UPI003BB03FDA
MPERRSCNYYGWCRVINKTWKLKNGGFTLMEVILVLAILMAGLGIGLPAYHNLTVQKEEERFFQLLRNDIYYAQSEAYRMKETVKLIFQSDLGVYNVTQNMFLPSLASREIPASVTLIRSSNLTEIAYWPSGSVVASGTLRFNTSSGEKRVIVHLGKGRVVFSE